MAVSEEALRRVLEPLTPEWQSRPPLRDAAVLVPWLVDRGDDWLLFTRRHDDLPSHAGEISFPGGGRHGQESPLQCALRESLEEIGLDPRAVTPLGRLPERQSIGGFHVHPVVGYVRTAQALTAAPSEVAEILHVPVAELRRAERWEQRDVPSLSGLPRRSWFFEFEGHVLWGLTARFTRDLLDRLA